VAGSCEYGDEPSGSGTTELYSHLVSDTRKCFICDSGTREKKVDEHWPRAQPSSY
jgi:hypothetical protein